jgi:hypothetical protein
MKIYRVCRNKTDHFDLSYGLVGTLAESGMLPLPGVLIKNRNTVLCTPGKVFTKSSNINKEKGDPKRMLFGYKDWFSFCHLYTPREIEWMYKEGWPVYEIDINPKYIVTSDLDEYQCIFDKTKITHCKLLNLNDVLNSYDEYYNDQSDFNYICTNMIDNVVDDTLSAIDIFIKINEGFTIGFRDEYSNKDTKLEDYRPKPTYRVSPGDNEWEELKELVEDCSNSEKNIEFFKRLYNKSIFKTITKDI